jgi:hypothetical protein
MSNASHLRSSGRWPGRRWALQKGATDSHRKAELLSGTEERDIMSKRRRERGSNEPPTLIRRPKLTQRTVRFVENASSHSSSCRSVTEGIRRQKDSGTISGEDDVEVLQASRLPTDQVIGPQFKTWHSSRMKTGLRNRIIGRKVSFAGRERA